MKMINRGISILITVMFIAALAFVPAKAMKTAASARNTNRRPTGILRTAEQIASNAPNASSLTHSHAKATIANNGTKNHCTAAITASVNTSSTLLSL